MTQTSVLRRRLTAPAVLAVLFCWPGVAAVGAAPPAERPAKPTYGRIGSALSRMYEAERSKAAGPRTFANEEAREQAALLESIHARTHLAATGGGYVTIDAIAVDGDGEALLRDLEDLGLRGGSHFRHMASGHFPISRLPDLNEVENLRFAKPFYPLPYVGVVDTQGDAAILADEARSDDSLNGTGVTVGVLSTSYNCITPPAVDPPGDAEPPARWTDEAIDISTSDLPGPAGTVVVLQELDTDASGSDCLPDTFATDEGRAMLQVVHDVAPGASLMFHSAANGTADFVQGILDLRDAGASVIADDLGVADEPFYMDGLVAQAIDQVVADGVTYFAAAGNWSNLSFRDNDADLHFDTDPIFGNLALNWDPDGEEEDYYLEIAIPEVTSAADAGAVIFLLQWNQPYASVTGGSGATTDLDLWILDAAGTAGAPTEADEPVDFCEIGQPDGAPNGKASNTGFDPSEVLQFINLSALGPCLGDPETTRFNLYVQLVSGDPPSHLQLIMLIPVLGSASGADLVEPYANGGGTIFGHANAAGAITVGAAHALGTPAFSGPNPPLVDPSSSIGPPTTIRRDATGAGITPITRTKPDLICPDGGNISFDPCAEHNFGGLPGIQYLCPVAEDDTVSSADDDDEDGSPATGNNDPEYPNFYGTSAAAAHCAGAAALLHQREALYPADVRDALIAGAIDMGTGGFDNATGWGFVQVGGIDGATAFIDSCPAANGFSAVVSGGTTAAGVAAVEACRMITASGHTVETSADLTYSAGQRIVLGDGFTVQDGAAFTIEIDPGLDI
jgi:Subtilase family